MLTVILSFLRSHWQTTLIASTVVSVIATITIQHVENRHLAALIKQCHAENITLETSNKALLESVESQNAAIAAFHTQGERKKSAVARALKSASADVDHYYALSSQIEARSASNDECGDLKRLVNDFVASHPH